jgi:ATP-dependent DNA helicase RecG
LPVEVQKYDTRTILEALHNCLAHQDYERSERVLVTERADRLVFESAGAFFEGDVDDYLAGRCTPKRYRNPWLAQAMAQVGMIDTMGYGIYTMTGAQRERYLPLPDYRRSTAASVILEVLGRPMDLNYSQLLLERHDLDLDTVISLDRVQKGLPLTEPTIARLRREGFIEGRRPHLHVSARIAAATKTEVTYTQKRGVEKQQMKELLKGHLKRFPGARRQDIDKLLYPLLPNGLNDTQRKDKITNLLSEMKKRDGSIRSTGRGPVAAWYVTEQA